ncbi:MAG: element excision factor XisI family protein [Microcystis sp.]|uniref:Uncharacterized protein n=2 Tax=Microcystis wesenbergii TaxID=44823 RepID=A0A552LNV0_9CHRO|nr:XisI protein [Microcystis wesenbergii FACHB-1317]NCQ91126.1 hypothetical protein [Microcystis aeruginosa LG13-13]NCQ97546.1 hypothetical protein [Microcystis aeruginosa W11-03]NCR04317.1 hypothetical protein [Microcystis aeruginosa LG13-03]NCR62621.1 hypothetical protein [Microcystis aeruginosa LG11-05]NCR72318.1 hypothetical protein [Microcystis aeruginosa LG13-12]NCR96040.1 hypothetical protein [Microcystis aeruginosa W11-06]REJ58034.1 MAG: hypothetical protein DWQ58_04265 [Microcystis 
MRRFVYGKLAPSDPVKTETVFDTKQYHYLLFHLVWSDSITRIYGCIIHVDIINIPLVKIKNCC